jgi:hypothetical protein
MIDERLLKSLLFTLIDKKGVNLQWIDGCIRKEIKIYQLNYY